MQPNTIFQCSHFARWHCTPNPIFHLITHAYISLMLLLEYLLPYIALDNILVLQKIFNFFLLIKWCDTLIWFDLSWFVGFLANAIEPWLSHIMVVAHDSHCLLWYITYVPISCLSQMASFVYRFMAMYSTSIVDCTTVCCHLVFHDMGPSLTKKTYVEVDLQFSTSPSNPHWNDLLCCYVGRRYATSYLKCPSSNAWYIWRPSNRSKPVST